MSRKFDQVSRPLPRRKVPERCTANALGHYWLIGAYLAAAVRGGKYPALARFFGRHRKREGLIWYACRDCGWCDCVTEDRLPEPGRVKLCRDCSGLLPYNRYANNQPARCSACRRKKHNQRDNERKKKRRHERILTRGRYCAGCRTALPVKLGRKSSPYCDECRVERRRKSWRDYFHRQKEQAA